MRAALAFALVAAHWATAVPAAELPDLIERIKPSIVGIGTHVPTRRPPSVLTGTGFAVADGHTIVTNAHVVADARDDEILKSIVVFVPGEDRPAVRPARLLTIDREHDLALLSVGGEPLPVLEFASGAAVREGQSVFFTGFPVGAVLGLHPVTHRGIVASISPAVVPQPSARTLTAEQIHRIRKPFSVFQLDATAYPGNSGSPVMRYSDGRLIGVLNSVFVKRTKEHVLSDPSGIAYAIPAAHLEALLKRPAIGQR